MKTLSRRPPAPKPKLGQRRVFAGSSSPMVGVECFDCYLLEVRRGAWVVSIDDVGNEVKTERDPSIVLFANIGDRLVVSARDLDVDLVASVVVVAISGSSPQPTVQLVAGSMPVGEIVIQPVRRARVATRKARPPC